MLGGGARQLAVQQQRVAPCSLSIRRQQRRLSVVCYKHHSSSHDEPGKKRFPLNEGLPLSLFHPFKRLPPEGTTVPLEEEHCDPEENRCKTPLHVYEARCTTCSGSGWARAPSNGRRGHLCTCMVCHGLGYVRRTTSRFCPDDPDKHMTIARPLTWNGKFAARIASHTSTSGSNGAGSSNGVVSNGVASSNGASNSSNGATSSRGSSIGASSIGSHQTQAINSKGSTRH